MLYKKKKFGRKWELINNGLNKSGLQCYTISFTRCLEKYDGCFRCMFLVETKQRGYKRCDLCDNSIYYSVCINNNFNYYATEKTPNYNKE